MFVRASKATTSKKSLILKSFRLYGTILTIIDLVIDMICQVHD